MNTGVSFMYCFESDRGEKNFVIASDIHEATEAMGDVMTQREISLEKEKKENEQALFDVSIFSFMKRGYRYAN